MVAGAKVCPPGASVAKVRLKSEEKLLLEIERITEILPSKSYYYCVLKFICAKQACSVCTSQR